MDLFNFKPTCSGADPKNNGTGFEWYGAYNKTDLTAQKPTDDGVSIHFSVGIDNLYPFPWPL